MTEIDELPEPTPVENKVNYESINGALIQSNEYFDENFERKNEKGYMIDQYRGVTSAKEDLTDQHRGTSKNFQNDLKYGSAQEGPYFYTPIAFVIKTEIEHHDVLITKAIGVQK